MFVADNVQLHGQSLSKHFHSIRVANIKWVYIS